MGKKKKSSLLSGSNSFGLQGPAWKGGPVITLPITLQSNLTQLPINTNFPPTHIYSLTAQPVIMPIDERTKSTQ